MKYFITMATIVVFIIIALVTMINVECEEVLETSGSTCQQVNQGK